MFDELEKAGVFCCLKDLGIVAKYLNPLLLLINRLEDIAY